MLTLLAQINPPQTIDIAGRVSQIGGINSISRLIEIGAGAVLTIGGLAFLVYLLMGGFNWITAGGDKAKVEHAREMITQGIIGIAILASVFAVYGVIIRFLGLKGVSVGGGSFSSSTTTTGECSDYCAGNKNDSSGDQCQTQGGHRVASRCSGGNCDGVTYPCLIP